jgi:arginase
MKNRALLFPFYIDAPLTGFHPGGSEGWEVFHAPDLLPGSQVERLASLYFSLADRVAATAGSGDRPITFAGDCCTAVPMLAGLQRAGINPFLIWFDAHGDFNTWETTPSGFLGGMPLAWLVGRGEQTMPEAVGLRPLPEADVILADARDLDPGEAEAVAYSGMTHLKSTLDLLDHPLPERPLWVHFDTDVIRPEDAPAMNYLAPGGPSAEDLGRVFDRLAATGRICAVSVSAWNPALDPTGHTEGVVMGLFRRLIQK